MTSLRRLRKGLRNLAEDLDRAERQEAGARVKPFLFLKREGEYYVSAETGVPYCRVEDLCSEDPPLRHMMLALTARMRREEAEKLAPLFGDEPYTGEADPEAWSLRSRQCHQDQPWRQDDDDQDGGRKVPDNDAPDDPMGPSTTPKDPRRRARRRDISVDFRV